MEKLNFELLYSILNTAKTKINTKKKLLFLFSSFFFSESSGLFNKIECQIKLELENTEIFTSRESMASFIIWIQPLNVATWKRHRYALPT